MRKSKKLLGSLQNAELFCNMLSSIRPSGGNEKRLLVALVQNVRVPVERKDTKCHAKHRAGAVGLSRVGKRLG